MATELAARPNGALTDRADSQHAEWERKLDLIRRTVANGCTQDELDLFLYQARRTGLDPLLRQIYCIRRRSGDEYRATIQTGIDGYRLIADRTGLYAGNDDPVFAGERYLNSDREPAAAAPEAATVTVWKLVGGQRCPFTATARWSEYYPGDRQGQMWRRMPYLMLSKTAEALALRKAFPADLSGIYTHDEMAQADAETALPATRNTPARFTERPRRPALAASGPPPDADDEPPFEAFAAEAGEAATADGPAERGDEPLATYKQLETLASMAKRAGREIDTTGLTRSRASALISSLINEMPARPQP
jgi:phage recombination protein Bet